ncbi:uncharacterized protein LOC128546539 [Mercenaria mercenaria]|uniref:uncharacterized protein LOC128546539 n=1 Tax=Mercenaria mercenaria TaxID=6596 RepID=UPI00234F03BE|nr:uncharacterized protein LOC128546539 [Mercenaria mercenaria]XP_053373219.1 uncharacterized protein LOC128546539 [Mercenaria mercenaria]
MANKCLESKECCVAFILGIVVLVVMDIAKFCVGAGYYRDEHTNKSKVCAQMEHIPLYLILSARAPWYFYKVISAKGIVCAFLFIAFVLFYFVWLIIGSVWIYPNCKAILVNETDPSCNKSLMVFAASAVTVDWISAIWVTCLLCALLCNK